MHECLSVRVAASNRSLHKGVPHALKASALAAFLLFALSFALAQDYIHQPDQLTPDSTAPIKKPMIMRGTVVVPASSQLNVADLGKRAHTNVRYILPVFSSPDEAPPYTGYAYETPASIACIYGTVTALTGCNPNTVTNTPTGGSQSIAIVDAYDDPNAPSDLAYFSAQFGLPFSPEKFEVVYQTPGVQPYQDYTGGWELEESLDIEFAHAMAPNAKLYLVEANSNYDSGPVRFRRDSHPPGAVRPGYHLPSGHHRPSLDEG